MKFINLEDELKESYENFRKKKEDEIVAKQDDDPSVFYKFAKSKAVITSNIGPL